MEIGAVTQKSRPIPVFGRAPAPTVEVQKDGGHFPSFAGAWLVVSAFPDEPILDLC